VADWLKLRHQSTVGLLDRAEERGLLKRISDPQDHRRQELVLTPLGQSRLDTLSALHRDELRRFREEGFPYVQTTL
jgi:DNA-binding MarR family transcriptional regulator